LSKGQSLIIQFIMFFLIGFTIFIGVSQFFRYQSDIFKDDVTRESLKIINSYFSSYAIASVASCKQCDEVNLTFKTANTTAGNFFEVSFGSYGANVTIPFVTNVKFISPAHNLNESFQLNGSVPSTRPITLTFNKMQNKLYIE
jgi:hypothetical protein